MTKVFIDGSEGTTGLRIFERFEKRDDITLLKIDPEKRKDPAERKKLINQSEAYQVFQISQTQPSEVHFFDQDLRETDQRNVQTAKILSQVRYFYFIDKYGLQWEFEQGHSDIGD